MNSLGSARRELDHLEAFKIALDTRNLEIQLFWQRSNYFLALNTATAIGYFSLERTEFGIPLALVGLVSSVLWVWVSCGGKFWQTRWEWRLREAEEQLGANHLLFSVTRNDVVRDVAESHKFDRHVGLASLVDRIVLRKPSVSLGMILLALLFSIVWLGFLASEVASVIYLRIVASTPNMIAHGPASAESPNILQMIAPIANVVVGAIALLVSWLAVRVARDTRDYQREASVNAVRPLPFLALNDFEDRLSIVLRNHGTGPLLINKLSVVSDGATMSSVMDAISPLPKGMYWTTFVEDLQDRSMPPNGEIELLTLDGDDSQQSFVQARDNYRRELAVLKVVVDYTDIYGSSFMSYQRSLDWFGRHSRD